MAKPIITTIVIIINPTTIRSNVERVFRKRTITLSKVLKNDDVFINFILKNKKPTTGSSRSHSYQFPDMAEHATP